MLEKIMSVLTEDELVGIVEQYISKQNLSKLGPRTVESLHKKEIWGAIAKAAELDGHKELAEILFAAEERWHDLEVKL